MDLMLLVPENQDKSTPQYIVHTKYNCVVPSEEDEIEETFRKGNLSRWRRWYLRCCILSKTHPYIQMHLKSNAVIKYEIIKHITLYPNMIHPTSRFRYFWEWFQIFFTYIALIIIPVINSFYFDVYIKWMPLMLFMNFIFSLDMLLCFFTGYVDSNTCHVILDSKLVTSNYLKSYFIWDLISSLPMELVDVFWHKINPMTSVFVSAYNSLTFMRIKHILKYARNMQHTHRFPLKVYKIFEISTILTLFLHWGACLQYYVPKILKYSGLVVDFEEDSWIWSENMIKRKTVIEKYILCLNRAVISFVCSTHFLYSIAWEDIILNVIFSMMGKAAFIYLLVQTMHLMTTYDTQNDQAKQQQQLDEYIRQKKLPTNIQKRLYIYCDYIHKKHFDSDKNILNDIPKKLREVI